MAWIDFDGEGATIYDPTNGITDEEVDLSWFREGNGSARVLVIRGDRRPTVWLDADGELAMWSTPNNSYSIAEQAYEVDEMDALAFDDDDSALLTWARACAFVDALNTLDGIQ